MMRRAIWSRLGAVCTVVALAAGCEQSSYSSSPDKPQQAAASGDVPASSDEPTVASSDEGSAAAAPAAADTSAAETAPTETASSEAPAASERPVNRAAADAGKQPTKELTFDDIKFDIEKDGKFERSMLTEEIEALVGRNVRIRGYILPTFQQAGIRNFVLVRDNMECCFGPGAALYDCIVVDMVEGQSTDFTTRPVAVEGKFGIQELLDFDGVVRAIYHLEGKAVK